MTLEIVSTLMPRIEQAAQELLAKGLSIIEIPEASGLMLVRIGTTEANQRLKETTLVVKEITFKGEGFLVCTR